MTIVRTLADDLTGAFDAGAAFVGMCGPIAVSWRNAGVPMTGSIVFDNEARNETDPDVAAMRTQNDLSLIDDADIAFKKIDSLMRGHTVAELQACVTSKRFSSIVLAPSFPRQGRITRKAQQFARFGEDGRWQPVGPSLLAAFSPAERAQHIGTSDRASGDGLFVCDAETEDDMRSLPMRLADVEPPVLWCGSAGLARALATVPTAPSHRPPGPALVVVGSNHAVSQAQVDSLKRAMPESICFLDGRQSLYKIRRFLNRRLAVGKCAVLATNFEATEPVMARQGIAQAIESVLPSLKIPEHFIVMGGETLLMVLEAVGAHSAIVKGEVMPGVSIGHAVGGMWDGVSFISKSGAFGSPSLLFDLLTDSLVGQSL